MEMAFSPFGENEQIYCSNTRVLKTPNAAYEQKVKRRHMFHTFIEKAYDSL